MVLGILEAPVDDLELLSGPAAVFQAAPKERSWAALWASVDGLGQLSELMWLVLSSFGVSVRGLGRGSGRKVVLSQAGAGSAVRCVSVIRKAQVSPRVWKCLRSTKDPQRKIRISLKNSRNPGSKLLT